MANSNPKTRPSKQERILTISTSGYQPPDIDDPLRTIEIKNWEEARPYVSVPYIRLKGQWLEDAGFHRRQRVRVAVGHGRLVITHA